MRVFPAALAVAVALSAGSCSPRDQRAPDQQAGGPGWLAVVVTDQLDRAIPGSTVVVSGKTPGSTSGGMTGQDGEFVSPRVPAGAYQVSVSKPAFKTATRTMSVETGKEANVRVVLELDAIRETVIVSAAAGAAVTTDPLPVPRKVGMPPVLDPCTGSPAGGCVLPPTKLVDAQPVYPSSAVRAGVSGTVVVHARVREDGYAGDVKADPGADPALALAAVEAVRVWQFSPGHLDGVAFPVDMTVTVKFELSK